MRSQKSLVMGTAGETMSDLKGWCIDGSEKLVAQHEGWTLSEVRDGPNHVNFWLYHCTYPQSSHRDKDDCKEVVCHTCKIDLSKQLSLIWKALPTERYWSNV